MNLHHGILQMRAGQRIECSKRLIKEQDFRLHRKRTGNTHTLLHAAGNFRRALVAGMHHLHQFQIVQHPRVTFGARLDSAEDLVYRQGHIVIDGQPWQQRMVLEHHRTLRARRVDLTLFEQNAA